MNLLHEITKFLTYTLDFAPIFQGPDDCMERFDLTKSTEIAIGKKSLNIEVIWHFHYEVKYFTHNEDTEVHSVDDEGTWFEVFVNGEKWSVPSECYDLDDDWMQTYWSQVMHLAVKSANGVYY